jgi:hypothetical protein
MRLDTRRFLVLCLIFIGGFEPLRGSVQDSTTTGIPVDSLVEDPDSAAIAVPVDSSSRQLAPVPFRVGERLVFSVEYGFVTAGEATMSVVSLDTIQGHPSYRIETVATTNEIFSTFYEVNDRVVSHMDAYRMFSRHFKKTLREGSYSKDLEVYFDQEAQLARYVEGDSLAALPETQDVLSAFFFLRSRNLRIGEVYSIPCHDNRKNYPLEVKVLRREKIAVPAGKFECFVVEPKLKSGGLTKKEAKMFIWLTSDDRKMPVLMETRMKIGSVAAKLREFSTGDGDAGGEER